MHLDEYRSFDAVGLAALVAERELAPDELLDAAVEAAAAHRSLNAVVSTFEDLARQAIAAGLPPGPLRGVPFALKDLWTQMAGTATTNGSRLFAGTTATADSEIVVRFRRAGLVAFAKTNSPELGLSPTTEPVLFGPTHNPWLTGYSAGGSSGGAAAAVAAGIIPVAHATDGGGSIRIPSSCCGVFGLKPSRGRVPFGPERGEGWGGMSTQHVVSRSVRDSAVALDAIAGPMPGDPYAALAPAEPFAASAGAPPGRLRIGLSVTPPGGTAVDPWCVAAAQATASRCEALGHHIEDIAWPFPPEPFAVARSTVIAPYVAAAVDRRLETLGRGLQPDDLEPLSRMIYEVGRRRSAVELVAGVQAMHQVGRALGELFAQIDVLLTPTLAAQPGALGRLACPDQDAFAALQALTAFTVIANISGQPAMSVPLDRAPSRLPVGSQFLGRYGDETTLFRLAGQLERAHPWPWFPPELRA